MRHEDALEAPEAQEAAKEQEAPETTRHEDALLNLEVPQITRQNVTQSEAQEAAKEQEACETTWHENALRKADALQITLISLIQVEAMWFFMNMVEATAKDCAIDLVMFSTKWMDYHVRRLFRERVYSGGKAYKERFVGLNKPKPFRGTNAKQIRYAYLLKASTDRHTPLEDVEIYEDLLAAAEAALLCSMGHCQCSKMEAKELRVELTRFFFGPEMHPLDEGTHIFSELIYCQDKKKPLEQHWLDDPVFPPPNDACFQLNNGDVLLDLGVKVVALGDLERRLNERRLLELVLCSSKLNRACVCLVRTFIERNIAGSYTFRYRTMVGVVKGTDSSTVQEIDLATAYLALASDGKTFILKHITNATCV